MIVVVMGVSGCGKTTIGRALAARLGVAFLDADEFHSAEAVAKMRAGVALTDDDRAPWLDRLNAVIGAHADVVLACSALKASYRERLTRGREAVRFVHLAGSPATIAARLTERAGHYMNPALLESQFAILEAPAAAITVDVSASPGAIVDRVLAALGGASGS